MTEVRAIAIIGGGFSGTVLAARLLRDARAPLRVIVINRSGRMARGVAYGTRSAVHVLNVPAGRMSAFPEDDHHFLNFARGIDPAITGGTFVTRSIYGDYLEHVLDESRASASAGVTFEQVIGDVVTIDVEVASPRVRLALRGGGEVLDVDAAVLASGNHPPADPPLRDPAFLASERYVRDPWSGGALDRVALDEPVLLIGTGLTMLDVALELDRRGHRGGMHAVSRRGLLPQPHRSPAHPAGHEHVPPGLLDGPATALHYLRSIRRHVAEVEHHDVDWRDVIASLRPITPQLWQRLPTNERVRFMNRLRPFWEVHRHRAAPAIASAIQSLLDACKLSVRAGRILALTESNGSATATIRPRGAAETIELRFGTVVNCTGPDSNVTSVNDPLLRSLMQIGVVRHDPLGLGLDFDNTYRLLRADGVANRSLFLLGPLLKGKLWEATAVPELREHARSLAGVLIG